MPRSASIAGLLAFILYSGASADDREQGQPLFGNAEYVVPVEELAGLRRAALEGSSEAAFRLYHFYDFVKQDYREGEYWAQIAAENGHPFGQYTYAFLLMHERRGLLLHRDDPKTRERDLARAVYWLRKAAESGVEEASERLRKLGEPVTSGEPNLP